ncbi:uncharacterized protein LACBIDRAFT_295048 [Laccaria bicolor S238N-H82]|uniref:Predicted protein n=1 Tax=Laccaria bicolor (strain S238N-H82 / ATCC MYA-4686) TaxID=486041 RepID=B0DLN4_LACBS|nr:uncharacterized protein LACBIDRAFT_295048 [Laccaria bicolor S238N-H82]EDR04421.1 predicted protein [Laccaria bicolor S238N-H82]|eukprot:XP_001884940.1 predicted protein [Laccaria bicolor S238N-H82]
MTTSEGRQNLGQSIDGRNPVQDASDGRGGTEPHPQAGPSSRYGIIRLLFLTSFILHSAVYYRLYTQEEPIKSNNPIYSNNPFISRIIPRSVPPPRTAASLKRHLCKIEGFSAPESCTLYLSLSENVPVDGGTRLSLQGELGPGKWEAVSGVNRDKGIGRGWGTGQTRYVYYRIYDENGEVTSKMSFNEDDTSLGRIEILSIPPPHTVASLKSCITKSEGVSAHDLQVFEDDTREITMKDEGIIALFADAYPGNAEEQPIAIVYKETQTSNPGTFAKKFRCKCPQSV